MSVVRWLPFLLPPIWECALQTALGHAVRRAAGHGAISEARSQFMRCQSWLPLLQIWRGAWQ